MFMKSVRRNVLMGLLVIALTALISVNALAADTPSIGVQVNDTALSFADVAPAAKDGRVYVPVRSVFEALGAQVDYLEETQTVKAVRGDRTVTMVIGQASVTIADASGTKTVELDAASYAVSNRVMVPVRAAAEAFGCKVGWDSENKTVMILDAQSILGANSAQYTIMDKYLAYSQKYRQAPYAITATFDLSMNITSEGETIPVVANATVSGLYNEDVCNFNMDMALDLSDLISSSGEEIDEESQQMLALLQNIKVEYIVDLTAGKMYMRSPLFSLALGITDTNTWLSIDLGTMLNGHDSLLSANETQDFGEYMDLMMGIMPMTDVSELTFAAELLQMVNTNCSDSAFVKNGDTYTNTISYQGDDMTAQGSVSFKMKDDSIVSVVMSMTLDSEEVTFDMNYSLDENGVLTMTMTMKTPDGIDMSLDYNLKYSETEEIPLSAPEEGSTVIPMDSYFESTL